MTLFKKLNQSPVCKNKSKIADGEELMEDMQFSVHKFSKKHKPDDPKKILIIGCFSEFGCEVLGAMYCIPRILKENPGCYCIVMGWYGRAYLYKHLVDEFWELKEEHQHLRDHALAFHHDSHNLAKVEKVVAKMGNAIPSSHLGFIAVGNSCNKCKYFWGSTKDMNCPNCNSDDLIRSLFSDVRYWKQRVVRIPPPSKEKLLLADTFLGKNPIGVIARNRKTYGRNLQPDFYVKLIELLEKKGYTPVWLGEKQTTLACPVPHIVDMTRKSEAADLELTLAIVSKLKFTVQFWTASTRLSAIMGTPYLLFESPDQLFGTGQEGYRLSLCTMGHRKIALCHYLNVYNHNDDAIDLIDKCVQEMELGDWSDVIGMVDDQNTVLQMRAENLERFG